MRPTQAGLSTMRLASGRKRKPSSVPASIAALLNTLPLQVGNLGEHGHNDLRGAATDRTQPTHIDVDTGIQKAAHRRLHVQGIPPEPV